MSGIPRDYPAGMNQFPQILRGRAAALQEEFLVMLISRDLHGRESLQHVMAVGDGAAEFRKDAVGSDSTERAPVPQQPVAWWVLWSNEHNAYWRANRQGYCNELIGAGLYTAAEAKEIASWSARPSPGGRQKDDARELALIVAILAKQPSTVGRLFAHQDAEIGRMRSGITEAIALLEGGTEYERMHVAGTLRGAL